MKIDTFTIQEELERILASRCFRSRKILGKFLSYIVRETLSENPAKITQHSIAVKGLGKHAGFDNTDPAHSCRMKPLAGLSSCAWAVIMRICQAASISAKPCWLMKRRGSKPTGLTMPSTNMAQIGSY